MNNYIIYPKQLRRHSIIVEKNRCFFLMPFNSEFDMVYGIIKKALNDNGVICNRADEISGSTPIIAKILTEIMKSQYIIVDITNSNPNVYYELGIAHTLKEARNVLLIKRKDYKVPFDITHLTYIEYDTSNYRLLVSTILSFIEDSKTKNALYDAINMRNIAGYIDDNNSDNFVEYLSNLDAETMNYMSKALIGEGNELTDNQTKTFIIKFKQITEDIIMLKDFKSLSVLLNIFYEVFVSVPENVHILDTVKLLLSDYFEYFSISSKLIDEYKTKLAILLVNKETYIDISLPWIINYFSRSKSTTIDLNRYSIESFLMTTTSDIVNKAIINSLCNENCYIREHMSDLIGEKRLIEASRLLYVQLEKEENYFTAQSMIEAIGKINQPGGISIIIDWIQKHKQEIIETNQLYVIKHALKAISSLDNTPGQPYLESFKNEFGQIINSYYIL